MNEARDEKTVTVYTPAMSLQEMQELRDLWAETAPHIPFVQLSGLMSGVVLTDNARASKAPMILDVNDVPERLRQLIVLYEDDVCGLIEAETLTPPDEVLNDLSGTALRGWMSGMGTAVGMNFQKFMAVMASPKEFGDIALIAMGFLAFAPQPLEDPLFNDVFSGQEQRFKETRDDFLQNWDKEPPAERQKVLNEMIAGLGFGYGLAQAITESINAKHAEEDFPHDWSSVTVRREGRKIRPNEPCPCGSGKKYKKCHGAPGAPALPQEE